MDARKIILFCHLAAGALVWFLTRSGLNYLYLSFYQVRRLAGIAALREAVPVALGALTFFLLFKNAQVNTVLEEVVAELRKVTWPAREDVVRSTTVVIICILIASFIFAGFDVMWGKIITFLLHS
jgi:preprotein translocase SecE subunit